MNMRPTALLKAIQFNLDELLKWDFVIGLAFMGGGIWMAISAPTRLSDQLVPITVGLVGVLLGAVLAAAAILGAFLDGAFLRKLKRIGREPTYYFAPFLFTALMGTVALLVLLVLLALPDTGWTPLRATIAALGGMSTGWALGSLIYDLDMLVQFLALQDAAADVADEPPQGKEDVPRIPRHG